MYALGAALDVAFDAHLLQFVVDRLYELLYICIARTLCGVQLVLDHIVGIVLQIFQTQVLQFALQLVESQFVSQRSVQIACLLCHPALCLLVGCVAYLSHQIDAVGNHNQNNAHVFGK